MTDRPQWTRAIQRFLGDTIIDEEYGYPMDGSHDDLLDELESVVNEILCREFGHEIEDDQCMIPEHRYCVSCGRRATDITADQEDTS